MSAVPPVAPKAQEFTISIKFHSPDVGIYPAVEPTGVTITFDADTCRFVGGETLVDFSAGMTLTELHRITKSAPSVNIETNFLTPSELLAAYQAGGPVCKVTVTANNQIDGNGANTQLVHYGICPRPDMDFLGNPGKVSVTIAPYGKEPELTHTGLDD